MNTVIAAIVSVVVDAEQLSALNQPAMQFCRPAKRIDVAGVKLMPEINVTECVEQDLVEFSRRLTLSKTHSE